MERVWIECCVFHNVTAATDRKKCLLCFASLSDSFQLCNSIYWYTHQLMHANVYVYTRIIYVCIHMHSTCFRSAQAHARSFFCMHAQTGVCTHTMQLAHTLGMHGIKRREEEKNLTHIQYAGRHVPDYSYLCTYVGELCKAGYQTIYIYTHHAGGSLHTSQISHLLLYL